MSDVKKEKTVDMHNYLPESTVEMLYDLKAFFGLSTRNKTMDKIIRSSHKKHCE